MSAFEEQMARAKICNWRRAPLAVVDELALVLSRWPRRGGRGIC